MKDLGKLFYKYRSYTPLPFVFVMLLFVDSNITILIIGFIIAMIGESIRIWAVGYFGSVSRATSQFVDASLITQGPYSYLRNPLYLGNIIIYLGLGIMSLSFFPYLQLFALVYFSFQYYCIVLSEEEYLSNKYNGLYENYRKKVKRFFPKKNLIPSEISSNLSFNLYAGFKSDKRSLQALLITAILILIFYLFDISLPDLF
jgi:protein-S-isoprenylcysteine O-methyltransferase Ste14